MAAIASLFFTLFVQLGLFLSNIADVWVPVVVVWIIFKLLLQRRFRRQWRLRLKRLAIAILLFYLLLIATLWVIQPRLLYHPSHVLQTTPASYNLKYEEVWIPADKAAKHLEHLHSWWIPHPKNRIGTLIYFHGADLNIGFNVTQAFWLRQLGFNVLLVEYRGYGLSEGGFPSETSLYEDAEAALTYLTQVQEIAADEIFCMDILWGVRSR
ncbi:MAG: hypothetical protein HC800_04540 [Phormidesmis sp. RL_2_1]|nr:hypothetical protein [Phormidesmis sp. RL_2_1]